MSEEKRVAAFRALRYDTSAVGSLSDVLAPPYDVITTEAAEELRKRSEGNIVRVTLPEGGGDEKYARAANVLEGWIREGTMVREADPSMYVHRHHFDLDGAERARTGIWLLLRLVPFEAGIVLPHERTMKGPKADRLALMQACHAHLSPIFFICSDPEGTISRKLAELSAGEPRERAEFPAGERQEIWRLSDSDDLHELSVALSEQIFLIADGHHRYETALAYREKLIEAGAPETGDGGHQYVLAYAVPEGDEGLSLEPTHRVIAKNGQVDWRSVISGSEGQFKVRRLSEADVLEPEPLLRSQMGKASFLFVVGGEEGGWLLEPSGADTDIPAVALHEIFLQSVPGWAEVPLEGRVGFRRDASKAVDEVRSGAVQAAALLAPSAVAQIREAARSGQRLPPKTTYFQPKVPTGIAIHRVDPREDF